MTTPLEAYLQSQRENRAETLENIQQVGGIMGILAHVQQLRAAQDKTRALQGILSTSPVNSGVLSTDGPSIPYDKLLAAGAAGVDVNPFLRLNEQAENLAKRRAEVAAAESFRSTPGILGVGVTTASPQGRALMSNLTGDQDFDSAVLSAQNEALNSNPNLKAQAVTPARAGLFGPLMASQYVGPFARSMQQQIDQTPARSLDPKQLLQRYEHMQQQHMTSTNQAAAREDNAALRRELADRSDDLRRDLAGQSADLRRQLADQARRGATDRQNDLEAQRTFTRERGLANDYNGLSKDFRTALPAFQSAAQYVSGGKYDSSGDRSLAFSFARMLDPRDRVGVNDIRDINKLGNIPERMKQYIVGLAEGKMLPDRIRLEMFDVMHRQFASMNELQQQIEDEYETRAKQYMLKPENIVTRFAVRKNPQSEGWSIKVQ